MDRGGGGGGGVNRRGMPKSASGAASTFMPPPIRNGFIPRPPLEFKPPMNPRALAHPERTISSLTGLGQLMTAIAATPDVLPPPISDDAKPVPPHLRRAQRRAEHAAAHAAAVEAAVASWDPKSDPSIVGDAFKTLFVGRLAYETSEKKLAKELAEFGPIVKVSLVKDTEGKSRGYAFVEFEREEDMRAAYRSADGRRIDGRRIVVDVERGRTVRGWRPRRFGGGIGDTRAAVPRKKRRKDDWVRPSLVDYNVLSVATKAAREKAAADAMMAVSFSPADTRYTGLGTAGVPGYTARFEDKYRDAEKARVEAAAASVVAEGMASADGSGEYERGEEVAKPVRDPSAAPRDDAPVFTAAAEPEIVAAPAVLGDDDL